MSLAASYLEDVVFSFRKHKDLAEQAYHQVVADEDFFRKPAEHSNSIALIIKHLAGNLRSRWTDFLTTDGEKPWRDRDNEFMTAANDTRAGLDAAWEAGWAALFQSLADLGEDDLLKRVLIRGEPHTVLQAIDRALTHVAYHVGQIVYLSRLVQKEGWRWLTIPPGQSQQFGQRGSGYLGRA